MAEPVLRVPFRKVQDKLHAILLAGMWPEDSAYCTGCSRRPVRATAYPGAGLKPVRWFVKSLRDGDRSALIVLALKAFMFGNDPLMVMSPIFPVNASTRLPANT